MTALPTRLLALLWNPGNMNKFIFIAFLFAVLLRFGGIFYGLPLRLIADEPQFVFAAIEMAQENLFIPPYDEAGFRTLLYNPPYLIYLFLIPFWILIHIIHVTSFSYFFILARLLSAAAGLLTIWIAYKTAQQLFPQNKSAPFFTVYFLATSILAIALSATARHWSFAMLLGITGFYVLARSRISFHKRFLWVMGIAGLGIGVNQAIAIVAPLSILWYFIIEKGKLRNLLGARWFYAGIVLFLGLIIVPFLIYPQSLRGVAADEWGQSFSVSSFFGASFHFLSSFAWSEPVFLLFAIIGLAALWGRERKLFWIFLSIIFGYVYLFYFSYQFVHRYIAILLPFFAIIGGIGASMLWQKTRTWQRTITVVFLLLPFAVSVWFSILLLKEDSRSLARTWFQDHIPAGARVIVWSDLMRLSSLPEAIEEKAIFHQEKDPDELNEFTYPDLFAHKAFHALNLYNVNEDVLYENVKMYACLREYDYVITEESNFQSVTHREALAGLTAGAEALASFGAHDERYSITGSFFGGPPWGFFALPHFGPPVFIYKLDRKTLCADTAHRVRTIREERNFVPQDMSVGIDLHFDKRYNLHGSFETDAPALVFLLAKNEFEKIMSGGGHIIAPIKHFPFILPVESGDYVLGIVSQGKEVQYTVRLEVDEFFLDAN